MSRRVPARSEAAYLAAGRLNLLTLSGLRALHLKRALKKNLAFLDAKETKIFQHKGDLIMQDVEALSIQQGAYRDLYELFGVWGARPRPEGEPQGDVVINIHLGEARPETITVKGVRKGNGNGGNGGTNGR